MNWPYFTPPPHNPGVLDSLGITVSVRMLAAWPEFASAKRALYGTGWASRLWMRHIHPWLRPRRHSELTAEFEKHLSTVRSEFMNAVIEKKK